MKKTESMIVYGRNMVLESIGSGKISRIMVSSQSSSEDRIKEIISVAKREKVALEMTNHKELDRLCESAGHQGVAGVMEIPEPPTLSSILEDKRDATILLLNHIDYEQNLGALIRSAYAFGVDAVVVAPNGVHEVTSVVAKVSMGAVAFVPVVGMSLFQAIATLKKFAVKIVGVEVTKGKSVFEANIGSGAVALMLGGESVGLSGPLVKECDEFVYIPMIGKIGSLNVSVAGGVVMAERTRQKNL